MAWGSFNKYQLQLVRERVLGAEVYDLGAGDCRLARYLKRLGAARVVAVDKEPLPRRVAGVELEQGYFHEWVTRAPARLPVVFLSWPANHPMGGLVELVERADAVLYLGKNSNGTACGWPGLFRSLLQRPVLNYSPDRENDLIVFGSGSVTRGPTPHEQAALEAWSP